MTTPKERYGFNVYADGELVAITQGRSRAKKVARQMGGSYRHVVRAAPRYQHDRGTVSSYTENPGGGYVIQTMFSYGWDDAPWFLDGRPIIFETRQEAEREIIEMLAEGDDEEATPLHPDDFRVVEVNRSNPCFPRTTFLVKTEPGKERRWAVYKKGAKRASRRFRRKADAVDYARDRALNHRFSQLIIQGRDGKVKSVKYYGTLAAGESRFAAEDY